MMPQKNQQEYLKFPHLHNFHEPEVSEQKCHSSYQRIDPLYLTLGPGSNPRKLLSPARNAIWKFA